ncbi:MAG: hypothetical protein JW750_10470, partial [Anaerolineaceae bacterium]|nr:hypothetical protein [Anaerolineaceae bacterium]
MKTKLLLFRAMYIMAMIASLLTLPITAAAQAPIPFLIAFPADNAVEGWEWPEGETVQITIDNAPGLSWQGIAQVTTWGDPRTYFRVEFGGEYDLQTNDIITLSTDGVPPVSHQVQNLTVTDVNGELDTVSGAADI